MSTLVGNPYHGLWKSGVGLTLKNGNVLDLKASQRPDGGATAFGDMPLTQVYQSNSPAYDTQETVYDWMNKEADELISLYENP